MVNLFAWVQEISNYKRDGGVEGGYNELVSGRGWFASPAALAMLPRIRRRGSMQVLACLFGACLMGGAVSISARAAQQAPICPDMLMDFECAEYRQRLGQAGNAAQRQRIDSEYALIVEERHRLCPVPRKSGQRTAKFNPRSNL
jgi:hypothetical protein